MNLTDPIFTDEIKARAYFEDIRWPDGPVCPHCGETQRVYRLEGKSHRPGLFHCNSCSGQFTVTTGSVMESSHIPLHKWALAFRLYASSKKGFSANQLSRSLGITYKSAWFMAHRIREAMKEDTTTPIGGPGKTVEADETFLSKSRKTKRKAFERPKAQVMTLVERGGKTRSMIVDHRIPSTMLYGNLHPESRLVTDKAQHYKFPPAAKHESVNHSIGEYVRGDVHTNTLEGFFSIFKRGLVGTYQHVDLRHLERYLAEFDFRQNTRERLGVNDIARTAQMIKAAEGKRLTYRQPR